MFARLDDCFLNGGEFTSETEMNWEGHIEFDLGAAGDHSDGNLGRFKVRARVSFIFERIEPA